MPRNSDSDKSGALPGCLHCIMSFLFVRTLHLPARTLPSFVCLPVCLCWQIPRACESVWSLRGPLVCECPALVCACLPCACACALSALQYCASTCARFGCTRHASRVDTNPPPKKKNDRFPGLGSKWLIGCSPSAYSPVIRLGLRNPRKKEIKKDSCMRSCCNKGLAVWRHYNPKTKNQIHASPPTLCVVLPTSRGLVT